MNGYLKFRGYLFLKAEMRREARRIRRWSCSCNAPGGRTSGSTLTPEDYPAIVRICQLVDGNPLGIELAAAWVRTLVL